MGRPKTQKVETWECRGCRTTQALPKGITQGATCIVCGMRHAVVYDGRQRLILPYDVQEKDAQPLSVPHGQSLSIDTTRLK